MMKRRNFLQATLATAGAALAGCGSDGDGNTGGGGGGGGGTTTTPRPLEDGAKYFPQSVASGDPRPDSVILWTRLFDEAASGDLDLSLELSPDAEFSEYISLDGEQSLPLKAEAQFDGCVKVRLAGISPATVYYYRFIYEKGGKYYTSKIGRTKTAPAEDADVNVRFAFVSCQDYIGRYYNTYARLLKEEVDFIVHLGDYVYETTGDPTFQATEGRKLEFSDKKGAIAIVVESGTYYAARSLSNYRELYKTYRSDPVLQTVHERFPMIATWDDHEFSDDCHGAVASYFDGKQNEEDVNRRKAANQAWFEYMPVDYLGDPEFRYDPAKAFPGDIKIWRDFTFGKHVHLIMTDLRTYRADHLIPEEAFPGTVVVDEAALKDEFGDVPAAARPYVNIDDAAYAQHKAVLKGAAEAAGADPAAVTGNISVAFINAVVSQVNAALVLDEAAQEGLPRGIAYVDMGKGSFFSSIGSRYFTIKETFDIVSRVAYKKSKKSQDVMGAEQETWFLNTIKGSSRTWKIWGNEYCVLPLTIDLSVPPVPSDIPEQFKHVFYMNCDAWDGFNAKRDELLGVLANEGNVVAITGDIHAAYAGTPWVPGDPTKKIVEFVGPAITSGTYKSLIQSQVAADPTLSAVPGAAALAANIDTLFAAGPNSHLGFMDSVRHGFVVADVSEKEFVATYYRIAEKEVDTDYSQSDKLDGLFKVSTYKTIAGGRDLYELQEDGKYLKWNPETKAFE